MPSRSQLWMRICATPALPVSTACCLIRQVIALSPPQDLSSLFVPADLELTSLGINLLAALLLSHILGWHFVRYAPVMGHKEKLARVFIWVATTTLLIISVVKVSLALSLGLVGALSIIRFRTPIKEPEELAYLFVAVAIGVGLGAERLWETLLVFLVVLGAMALRSTRKPNEIGLRTILHVTVPTSTAASPLATILDLAQAHCERVDVRRVDRLADEFQASLFIDLTSTDKLQGLVDSMAESWPNSTVSIVERGVSE